MKGEGNQLDFGARIYDSRIGRWLSTDIKEKKYPNMSPYVFGGNTPTYMIDPDGKDIIPSGFKAYRYKDGSIKIVGSLYLTAQVINLSSKSDDEIDLGSVRQNLSSYLSDYLNINFSHDEFSYDDTKDGLIVLTSKNQSHKVTYEINTKVLVTEASSRDEIGDRSHVLAIVDDIRSGNELGISFIGGRIAQMKAADLADTKRRNEGFLTAVHEMLHLFGARDHYKTGKDKTAKDVMNYEPNSGWFLHDEHIEEIIEETIGNWNKVWREINENGDLTPSKYEGTSKDELKKILEKTNSTISK